MEHAPYERLKWRVLRYAGALPSEKRAQEMTDADFETSYCDRQQTYWSQN